MLLTVFCAPRNRPEVTFSLEVSPELELRDFTALCELESGIPAAEIQISYAEQPLQDPSRALGAYGLKDGDVVVLRQTEGRPPAQPAFPGLPRIDFSSIAVPGTSSGQHPTPQPPLQNQNPQQQRSQQLPTPPSLTGTASSPQGLDNPSLLRDMLLANPHELSLLKERNPLLAEALLSGDLERFTKVLLEQQQERARREQERIRLLTADPFDLEAQAKIEEEIRQHNIEENMTIAMEEAPESFGQVVMLYINCKVNGHPVKAFVDSGAQMTIMSQACAERCNIMRLVDRRWAGIAKGVGTQKIIGRVHLAQVQIEGDFLPCSFSILEDQPMDMLLGLDMLKRHQCSIDLKKSVLLIGTTGSETRFLPEAELPDCARLAYGADTRPEEIADRELAEALQRSAQESDIEDGQTTSPQSLPYSLTTCNDEDSKFSPSPDYPRNPALDRSKSAPAFLHSPLREETGVSGPSHNQLPFYGDSGPASVSLEEEIHLDPSVAPLDSCSPQDPLTDPPEDEALSQTLKQGAAPDLAPQVGADTGRNETAAVPLLPVAHPDPIPTSSQEMMEEHLSGTRHPHLILPQECPDSRNDREETVVEMESHSPQCPHQVPLDAELHPELDLCINGPTPQNDLSTESISRCTERVDLPVPTANERVPPEGELQLKSESMPSLAAALMELHELLVSSSRNLSRDHSPVSSPMHRQDADGGDGDNIMEYQTPTGSDDTASESTEPNSTSLKSPSAPSAASLAPLTIDSSDPAGSTGREVCDGRNREEEVVYFDNLRESAMCLNAEREGDQGSEVELDPLAQSNSDNLKLRESPEGEQDRGVADGHAAVSGPLNPLPSRAEVIAPPTCCTTAPDEVSNPTTLSSSLPTFSPTSLPLSQPLIPSSASPLVPLSLPSTPPPLIEQFPEAHIQRILEAGFSVREAHEALERAEGVVELALLVLLARKITVPT
ncbi:protein DDI1 homolog 2 isoform X1 [Scleropages formosus]|uniref:DNA-damage inducible protein 2 n=1 Tax=Scleropages formosus TaxID=113540 RepID=A0A8C9RC73_SCLFO|nr:uncharacterized protein LOC108933934 isoform X1 [Scleropages formosus]